MCHNLITPGLFFVPMSLVGLEANSYFLSWKHDCFHKETRDSPVLGKLRQKRARGPRRQGHSASSWWLVPWSSWKSFRLNCVQEGRFLFFSPQNLLRQQSLVSRALQQFLPDSQVLMRLQTGFWLGRNWKSKSSRVSYQQDKEAATGWNQASPGLTFKKVTNFYVLPPFGKGTALSSRNKNKIWN